MAESGEGSGAAAVPGYVIQADGVSDDVLRLAEAWLNDSEGDALAALVNLTVRTLQMRSVMCRGMARGKLDVWPDNADSG